MVFRKQPGEKAFQAFISAVTISEHRPSKTSRPAETSTSWNSMASLLKPCTSTILKTALCMLITSFSNNGGWRFISDT